jgi:hypothetical protein
MVRLLNRKLRPILSPALRGIRSFESLRTNGVEGVDSEMLKLLFLSPLVIIFCKSQLWQTTCSFFINDPVAEGMVL